MPIHPTLADINIKIHSWILLPLTSICSTLWKEIRIASFNYRKGLVYAPRLMRMIKKVTQLTHKLHLKPDVSSWAGPSPGRASPQGLGRLRSLPPSAQQAAPVACLGAFSFISHLAEPLLRFQISLFIPVTLSISKHINPKHDLETK